MFGIKNEKKIFISIKKCIFVAEKLPYLTHLSEEQRFCCSSIFLQF